MQRPPDKVIVDQAKQAQAKGDHRGLFPRNTPEQDAFIEMEELADHPETIGADPENDGQVMAYFAHEGFVPEHDPDGYGQGGDHHDDTEGSPNHAPADILQQPEYDVQVLHLPETEGNIVGLFCGHTSYKL